MRRSQIIVFTKTDKLLCLQLQNNKIIAKSNVAVTTQSCSGMTSSRDGL